MLTKRYTSWHRGEHLREWAVLRHVHRHEPELVPRPLAADLDARPPSVAMSRLPGAPLGGTLTDAQRCALATAIDMLWSVPCAPSPEIGPWTDDLGFARRLTDGPRPVGGMTAVAYDAAQAWWDGPDPALLRQQPDVTVLGHRDPNLANYLWDGRRVRIVDFEDSAVSDPATELAIFAEHLSTRAVDAGEFCASFEVDQQRLRAGRRLWAMFWLRLLLPGGPAARRNPPGSADTQARRLLTLLRS
ncbi:aminoglycoside phosphotransferase family protein [Micromonospora sp. RTP1Z1]|uniref:phosphotransferase family protein n=1 Tax=Micromonospora sp. RTP1Z1 TaxID=2994043 RepID=UPI0029C926A5|nr:aminoglycoside phosphotransferase family protein [Micromonospora sp. RTP1Z1]